MKKLFLFAAACVLVACNSQNEVLNPKSEALLDESPKEMALSSMIEPYKTMVNQYFISSNQKFLFEYLAYSGSVHTDTYVVDTYYTDENKGASFTDPLTGRTFFYEGIIAKVGKSIPSRSQETRQLFSELFLVYIPDMNCHKLSYVDIIDRHIYPGQLVREIGFTAHFFYDSVDESKFINGTWGVLRQYYSNHQKGYRTFGERYGEEYTGLPIWNGGSTSFGIVAFR